MWGTQSRSGGERCKISGRVAAKDRERSTSPKRRRLDGQGSSQAGVGRSKTSGRERAGSLGKGCSPRRSGVRSSHQMKEEVVREGQRKERKDRSQADQSRMICQDAMSREGCARQSCR